MNGEELFNNVVMNIYREMYKKATPSLDLDKILDSKPEKDWYLDYYLHEDEQLEIINKWCKLFRLNDFDKDRVKLIVTLGITPSSVKKE